MWFCSQPNIPLSKSSKWAIEERGGGEKGGEKRGRRKKRVPSRTMDAIIGDVWL